MKLAPSKGTTASGPVLICGGAGFIGTNLAARLLSDGESVIIYDDLSRPGVDVNLNWLKEQFGSRVHAEIADICDARTLRRSVRSASAVFHFAAQTAVTTSLVSPRTDFDVNLIGTITLLEELRQMPLRIPLIFTSTNKVYGDLNGIPVQRNGRRYTPQDRDVLREGIGESCPLSFHSPYGCSKGAADQYVIDYARSFKLPNVVFRMSCIYGPHQCGTEDQGWVAHFVIQALKGNAITVFGDGMQVRDLLYAEDLMEAFLLARANAIRLSGRAFNMGGGPENAASLLELLELIGALNGTEPDVNFEDWRIGDQRYYVSDTRAFQTATGWRPHVCVEEGVARLHSWLAGNRSGQDRIGTLELGAVHEGAR